MGHILDKYTLIEITVWVVVLSRSAHFVSLPISFISSTVRPYLNSLPVLKTVLYLSFVDDPSTQLHLYFIFVFAS